MTSSTLKKDYLCIDCSLWDSTWGIGGMCRLPASEILVQKGDQSVCEKTYCIDKSTVTSFKYPHFKEFVQALPYNYNSKDLKERSNE